MSPRHCAASVVCTCGSSHVAHIAWTTTSTTYQDNSIQKLEDITRALYAKICPPTKDTCISGTQTMGNCCGSASGNFEGEGRTLGAAPANAPAQSNTARAAVPPKVGGPGRTLGGNSQTSDQTPSAKEAAARAAEVRSLSTSASSIRKPQSRTSSGRRMISTVWL